METPTYAANHGVTVWDTADMCWVAHLGSCSCNCDSVRRYAFKVGKVTIGTRKMGVSVAACCPLDEIRLTAPYPTLRASHYSCIFKLPCPPQGPGLAAAAMYPSSGASRTGTSAPLCPLRRGEPPQSSSTQSARSPQNTPIRRLPGQLRAHPGSSSITLAENTLRVSCSVRSATVAAADVRGDAQSAGGPS